MCFVLPTREDVWGLVVGEAMAKGLPVITTNKCLAGLEMIRDGENGFVVAVENVQELADKILFLYENPQICIEMSKNNIAVMREYTIEEATKIDVKN